MHPFEVPARHKELLNKAFDEEWSPDKKLAGYSGAYVYQIIFRENAVVVKIAHPSVIQREFDSYKQFTVDSLRERAPRVSDHIVSNDGQEAMLRYTYAGIAHSQTLYEFLKDNGSPETVKDVCAILGRMFTVEQPNRPSSWWGRPGTKNIITREYYDRWLPVHLELKESNATNQVDVILDGRHIYRDRIAGLKPGHVVQLQEFQIEKEEAGVVTLYAGELRTPTLRLKLTGHYDPVKEAGATYAIVQETRKTRLEMYAEEAVGAFSMRSEIFTVDGQQYVNPLFYLDALLDARYDAIISTIHGDLNLRNILIEKKGSVGRGRLTKLFYRLLNMQIYDWWLIDFASTQEGPVLLDLQWLEAQVINWQLAPALRDAGKSPHDLATIFEALQAKRKLPLYLRSPKIDIAYRLLSQIRRLAEGYLVDQHDHQDRWCEYHRGLTLALISTLKHESITRELGEQAKEFALIAAATTVRWTGVKLPALAPRRQPLWRPLLTPRVIGVASGIVVLALLLYLWPFWSPGGPTQGCNKSLPKIKIGVAINEEGRYSIFAKDQIIGYQIAESYFNQQGGIQGRCIEIKSKNLKSRAEEVDSEWLREQFAALAAENVIALIGPGLSQQVELIADWLTMTEIPVIGPSTTKWQLICNKPYFLRISAPGIWYVAQAVMLAADGFRNEGLISGKLKVAVAYADNDAFTKAEATVFKNWIDEDKDNFELLEGEYSFQTDSDNQKLDALAQRLINDQPHIIIISGLTVDGGALIKALRTQEKQSYEGVIIGGNGLNTPYLFDSCVGAEATCAYFDDLFVPQAYSHEKTEFPIQTDFLTAHKAYDPTQYVNQKEKPHYDPNPGQFAAQMFTAVQVIVEALKSMDIQDQVLQAEGINDFRKALHAKLVSGNLTYETPLGAITFTPDGEVVQKQFYVAQSKKNADSKGYRFDIIREFSVDTVQQEALDECKATTNVP